MNLNAMLIAAILVLPAVALVAWAGLAMAQLEAELQRFVGDQNLPADEQPAV